MNLGTIIGIAAVVLGGLWILESTADAEELDDRAFDDVEDDLPNAPYSGPVVTIPPAENSGTAYINSVAISLTEKTIEWSSKMSIDYDGSPRAYAPPDSGLAPLDKLANAGRPGNWWGIATDTGLKTGKPIVQGPDDVAPGYYVSTTAKGTGGKKGTTAAYLNSEVVPYVAIPPELKGYGAALGNLARVEKDGKAYYAVVGDIGPGGKIGEGSFRLAQALEIVASKLREGGVKYTIFLGTKAPLSDAEIQQYGASLYG